MLSCCMYSRLSTFKQYVGIKVLSMSAADLAGAMLHEQYIVWVDYLQ